MIPPLNTSIFYIRMVQLLVTSALGQKFSQCSAGVVKLAAHKLKYEIALSFCQGFNLYIDENLYITKLLILLMVSEISRELKWKLSWQLELYKVICICRVVCSLLPFPCQGRMEKTLSYCDFSQLPVVTSPVKNRTRFLWKTRGNLKALLFRLCFASFGN